MENSSKEKQIEEIANVLYKSDNKRNVVICGIEAVAEDIYNAGYRKAADVALEVINTALSKIQIMISAIKALEESGNITEFNGGAKSTLEIVFKDLAELKKKYESEKDDGK